MSWKRDRNPYFRRDDDVDDGKGDKIPVFNCLRVSQAQAAITTLVRDFVRIRKMGTDDLTCSLTHNIRGNSIVIIVLI
jgi:hypothetical protein